MAGLDTLDEAQARAVNGGFFIIPPILPPPLPIRIGQWIAQHIHLPHIHFPHLF